MWLAPKLTWNIKAMCAERIRCTHWTKSAAGVKKEQKHILKKYKTFCSISEFRQCEFSPLDQSYIYSKRYCESAQWKRQTFDIRYYWGFGALHSIACLTLAQLITGAAFTTGIRNNYFLLLKKPLHILSTIKKMTEQIWFTAPTVFSR